MISPVFTLIPLLACLLLSCTPFCASHCLMTWLEREGNLCLSSRSTLCPVAWIVQLVGLESDMVIWRVAFGMFVGCCV